MAAVSRMVNSTTPTPSLNKDSPAMSISSVLATRACFSTASTAMGSVGLISAPNTSAQAKAMGTESSWPAPQNMAPTRIVEITTPSVAMAPTVHALSRNKDRSICSAPANSRKASMPSSKVSEKLIFSI